MVHTVVILSIWIVHTVMVLSMTRLLKVYLEKKSYLDFRELVAILQLVFHRSIRNIFDCV